MPTPSKNIRAERIIGSLDATEINFSGSLSSLTVTTISATTYENLPTLDATPTSGSTKGVQSGGVFDALANKFELPSLTSGSVLFSNGTTIAQKNASFFWDDANNRLGIGTETPTNALQINGTNSLSNSLGFINPTLATAGAGSIQQAPGILFSGSGWNTATLSPTSIRGRFIYRNSGNQALDIVNQRSGEFVFQNEYSGVFTDLLRIAGGPSGSAVTGVRTLQTFKANFQDSFAEFNSVINLNNNFNGAVNQTVEGLTLNSIAATTVNGRFAMFSPAFRQKAEALNASNVSQSLIFQTEVRTVSGTTPITGSWVLGSSLTGSAYVDRIVVNQNGNTGIGTSTDAGYKLDVSGTARFTDNIWLNQDKTIGITGDISNRPKIYFGSTGVFYNNWTFVPNTSGGIVVASGYQTITSTSAIFEVASTTRGFLPPRMTTTQRDAIATPATGLTVYNTTTLTPSFYNGTNWQNVLIPNSSGNTLIGTTVDSGFKLDVNGTARSQGNFYFGTAGSYLLGDSNNIRIVDKNSVPILQCFPSGVLNSETWLRSGGGLGNILRLRDDYISLEFTPSNVSSSVQNPIQITRGYFGNILATDKSVLHVRSILNSNITNGTTIRGIFIDINDTTTYTGFTNTRAIEAPRGGAYFNTTSVNASAVLQADSTTQGFLPPRMTTAQRDAIATPATGLQVYNTETNTNDYYDGTAWTAIGAGGGASSALFNYYNFT